MGVWVRNTVAITMVFSQSGWGSEAIPSITLWVKEQTPVPDPARDEAKGELSRIFGKAGIEALWLDCPAVRTREAPCYQKPGPRDLVIRILGGLSAPRSGHIFGSSLIVDDGFSSNASIFYGEIRARSQGQEVFEGRILGYTIAHEVGHLLLGWDSHFPAGIMMPYWKSNALRNAPRGAFLFTNQQAELLRARVGARLEAEKRAAEGL